MLQEPNTNPIRTARESKKWSQVELSIHSRVSLSTIRNAERGLATARTLRRLARALGVTVDDLTGRRAAQ